MAGLEEIIQVPRIGETLYSFPEALVTGTVIDRPNRFLVNVDFNGNSVPCHLHDPGRLRELIFPGNKVLIRNTKGIRTSHSVTAALDGNDWILTDTRVHSQIASRFLPAGIRKEVAVGNHRIDFQWQDTFIEVKGCTMLRNNAATFPDAPTKRGREHLELLRRHIANGGKSGLIVLAFRKSAQCFVPNSETDPDFSREFYGALSDGVEVFIPRLFFEDGNIKFGGHIGVCRH